MDLWAAKTQDLTDGADDRLTTKEEKVQPEAGQPAVTPEPAKETEKPKTEEKVPVTPVTPKAEEPAVQEKPAAEAQMQPAAPKAEVKEPEVKIPVAEPKPAPQAPAGQYLLKKGDESLIFAHTVPGQGSVQTQSNMNADVYLYDTVRKIKTRVIELRRGVQADNGKITDRGWVYARVGTPDDRLILTLNAILGVEGETGIMTSSIHH
jgi:hypothetical protein